MMRNSSVVDANVLWCSLICTEGPTDGKPDLIIRAC